MMIRCASRFPGLRVPKIASIAAVLLLPQAALADPQGLSRFVPITIEDAYPVAPGEFELQATGVWDHDTHDRRGDDLVTAQPTMKFGPFSGAEIYAGMPYRFGDASRRHGGDEVFGAFYNFNEQRDLLPAFAVNASYANPFGADARSGESILRLIATKSLGDPYSAPRLHINLSWYRLTDPAATERTDRYETAIGYSQSVAPHTAVVVDYVWAQKRSQGAHSNLIEAGLRHELNDHWSLSSGAGVGVGAESQDFRLLFAVQRSFSLF
jgi:hypothetical protein